MPLGGTSESHLSNAFARRRTLVQNCALGFALFASTNAVAMDAMATDQKIEFCKGPNRILFGPSVSVSVRRTTKKHGSDLEGWIGVGEDTSPFRGIEYIVKTGDAIALGGNVYRVDDLIYDEAGRAEHEKERAAE